MPTSLGMLLSPTAPPVSGSAYRASDAITSTSASVAMAWYTPRSRASGTDTNQPAAAPMATAASTASDTCRPARVSSSAQP